MESNKAEVKVSGLISEEMMKEYLVFHTRKTTIWYTVIWMFIYAVLLRITMPDLSIIFYPFAMLFLGIIVWYMVPWVTKKKGIKEYRSDQLMQQEVFYTINAEGISQKIRRSEMLTRWEDLLSIHETKNLFLFYISKNKAIVIPHKFMVKHELQLLRKLIKENENSQGAAIEYKEQVTRNQAANPDDLSFTIFISEKIYLDYFNFLAKKAIAMLPFGFMGAYFLLALLLFERITILVAASSVLVGVASWYFMVTYLNWKVTNEYRSDRRFHNDIHIEITAEGITQTLPNAKSQYTWDNIISIHETKSAFLFFVSKTKAIILPQRYVGHEEKAKLKKIINEHAKSKKVVYMNKAS